MSTGFELNSSRYLQLDKAWIIAKEVAVTFENLPDKELGYIVVQGFPVFYSEQHCMDMLASEPFELGWVCIRLDQLFNNR